MSGHIGGYPRAEGRFGCLNRLRAPGFHLRADSRMYGRLQRLELAAVWVTFAHMGSDKWGGKKKRRMTPRGWRLHWLAWQPGQRMKANHHSGGFSFGGTSWLDDSWRIFLKCVRQESTYIHMCVCVYVLLLYDNINQPNSSCKRDLLFIARVLPFSLPFSCGNNIVTRFGDEVNFASLLRTSRRHPITQQKALKAQRESPVFLHCDVSP